MHDAAPAIAAARLDDAAQQLVDLAHAELGRGIGLDDPALNAIAYSAQPGAVDDVRLESIIRRTTATAVAAWLEGLGIGCSRGPIRIPANPDLRMRARVCVPVWSDDELLGFLWLLDSPDQLSESELEIAGDFADRLAVSLARERSLERRERAAESELVRQLVAGELTHNELPHDLLAASGLVVAVVQVGAATASRGEGRSLPAAVEDFRRAFPPRRLLIGAGAEEAVLVFLDSAADVGAGLRDRLLPLLPPGARIGIGRERSDGSEIAAAHREARLAAVAAGRLPAHGPVARWSSLGAFRTILEMTDGGGDPGGRIPEALLRLREARNGAALIATLETYLETAGESKVTAAAFSIHRSSLYLRLRRIEEIAEVDLRRGDDRLNLHLGLCLMQLRSEERA